MVAKGRRTTPVFRKVDCVRLPVRDLEAALGFYRYGLGHELIWRTAEGAGLRLPGSEAEIALDLDTALTAPEIDFYVDSVPDAITRFGAAGGQIIEGPFEIAIGQCAVVADPEGNHLVILDTTKGRFETDASGNVVGLRQPEVQ
jgi:predicted enzyme related to lactoylglutathione lyase